MRTSIDEQQAVPDPDGAGEGLPSVRDAFIGLAIGVATLFRNFKNQAWEASFTSKGRPIEILISGKGLFFNWPDRPDDVEIHLDGPDEMHYWTCRYVGGKLTDLRFDNN
jgi:hypothetical protein